MGKVRARRYRNPKIGEFFKEIDLSKKKSMGISKIVRELKRNGSPMPEFEIDAGRTYMITTIRIHEKFQTEDERGCRTKNISAQLLCTVPEHPFRALFQTDPYRNVQ